jgi:hypothetical protein
MMKRHEGRDGRAAGWKMSSTGSMTTAELHRLFLKSLGSTLVGPEPDDLVRKPINVDVKSPLPSPLRAYLFTLTYSVSERQQGAYRAQLILPGHRRRGGRAHFDTSGGAFVVVAGYEPDIEVFSLWDAGLHDRGAGVPYSKGMQVEGSTVFAAASEGLAEQSRRLRQGGPATETVVAVRRDQLVRGLRRRWDLTSQRLLNEPMP